MTRRLLILLSLLLIYSTGLSVVSAQRGDHLSPRQVCGVPGGPPCPTSTPPPRDFDGDGVPDGNDRCPGVPGPASNGGCPEDTPAPGDQDGDGIPDVNDRCPGAGGPASNNGCPLDQAGTPIPTSVPALVLPTLPETGDCVLATQGATRINIRANPSLNADIVGQLDPQLLYPVLATLENSEGMWARIAEGWAASWVVRMGGFCDLLPYVEQSNPNEAPGSPNLSNFEFEVVGAAPSTGGEEVSCSNNLHIAGNLVIDPDMGGLAEDHSENISWSFGGASPDEGAVPTDQFCIKIAPDAPGFIIDWTPGASAPPDPESEVGFVIDWYVGFCDGSVLPAEGGFCDGHAGEFPGGETYVIAIIQPAPGAQIPPDPDAQGIIIDWHIPFDPNTQGIIVDYNIGVDPNAGGLIINWQAPPDPDAQGIIIDFMPGGANPPGSENAIQDSEGPVGAAQPPDPDAQGIIIEWFPNGTGGGANGIIIYDTAGGENSAPVDPNAQGIIIVGGQPIPVGSMIEFVVQ